VRGKSVSAGSGPGRTRVARRGLGQRGEALAAEELTRQGYTLCDRNWRCPAGEVDIVVRRDDVWTFFEVRTRRGVSFGMPEESLTVPKRRRMAEVALSYLNEHGLDDANWRLGLVAIELDLAGHLLRTEIYESID